MNALYLPQVCLHVKFLAKPSLLLSTWISHYTYQRFDPHQISSTLEEGEWVKYAVCYDICIRITQHIHTKRMITRMYINSPFSLTSSTNGPTSCMGFVSMFESFIGSSLMMFSASILLDLGHLVSRTHEVRTKTEHGWWGYDGAMMEWHKSIKIEMKIKERRWAKREY